MNLMERNNRSKEQDWRDDIRDGRMEKQREDDLAVEDLDTDDGSGADAGTQGFLQRPYMTTVLLGVIVLLLICIIVLLLLMPGRRNAEVSNGDLQQNITEYAQEQKQNDVVKNVSGEAVVVKLPDQNDEGQSAGTVSGQELQTGKEPKQYRPGSDAFVSADGDKTAVVIDIEDENDVAYTKEFILNEALPYFADNNQDAIWDLAHLKRYVKLSSELEGTNQYYYMGSVNNSGRPDGKGLAIYEKNSYYYGSWSDGIRSGEGTWFRFYIGQKSKDNAMGKYTAHS